MTRTDPSNTHDASPATPHLRPRRVLILDPAGALPELDHALCQGLAERGCDVILATLPVAADSEAAPTPAYRRLPIGPERADHGDEPGLRQRLQSMAAVRREVGTFKPDAVVLASSDQPCLDRRLARFLRRRAIRTILCAHDVLPLDSDRDVFDVHRRLYRAAERILVFGAHARDQLITHFDYPAGRIAVTELGVEKIAATRRIEPAAARAELGIPADQRMVLCPGRITRSKGVDDLLRAFPTVLAQHPSARLWIVGPAASVDVATFASVAQRLGFGDRLAVRTVTATLAHMWLQAADVVIHPDWRVYSNTELARSCAWGRAVVATSAGAHGELLRDGETGWLVPPRDPTALAAAIAQALGDPAEARRRGEAAFQKMQSQGWATAIESLFYMVS